MWGVDVLRALHKAVEYFTEMGRLSMAAKNLRVSPLYWYYVHNNTEHMLIQRSTIASKAASEPVRHIMQRANVQEVAETMEKQGSKEDSIEFYNQVRQQMQS